MKLLYFFFFFIINFSLCSYDSEKMDFLTKQEFQRNFLLEHAEESNNEEEDDYTEIGKSLCPVLIGFIEIFKSIGLF